MAEYTYDEEGYNFYYFVLSVLSLGLVPLTLHTVFKAWRSKRQQASLASCHCEPCDRMRQTLATTKPNETVQSLTSPKILFLIVGWLLVALLAYQVSFAEPPKASWNPYDILGISEGASLQEVKKVYKRLSLLYHPDKVNPSEAKESEEKFIDISKAYQVLTDETVRRNYEEYGHPDGKQFFTMGVALPRSIVEGKNSKLVLAFYGIVFGLGLPYYIARWWNNSRRRTKDGILNATMSTFFKGLDLNMEFKDLVGLLASAAEFQEKAGVRPNEERELNELDKSIAREMNKLCGESYEPLDKSLPAYRRKANTLLCAHLLRVPVKSEALVTDQRFIVGQSIYDLQGLVQIAIAKESLPIATMLMELQQHLLQATYPGMPSVMQLPHINNDVLHRYFESRHKSIETVDDLMALSEKERGFFFKRMSSEKALDVMEVAQAIPRLTIRKAAFTVIGDEMVTKGAIVTFVIRLLNNHHKLDEEAIEEQESKGEEETDEGESSNNDGPLPLPHAPYFPGRKRPCWWIVLADAKSNKVNIPPIKVTDIVTTKVIRIQFAAPPTAGTYPFTLLVKSDTYLDTDLQQDVDLVVHDPADLPPEDEVDDSISDPESDSIAGQMKLVREQGLASALAGGAGQKEGQDEAAIDSDSDSSSDDE